MASQHLHVYDHYESIWREIDNGNYYGLATHPDLNTRINDVEKGHTPLFLACLRKQYEIAYLLLQSGADPNIVCKGVTPLYLSCLYGESETVDALLSFGANPNILCTSRKIAPLHLAALKGMLNVATNLMNHNAEVNPISPKYGTPLHVAVGKNHQIIFQYLLEKGATVNLTNEDGESPLHVVSRRGHTEIAKVLLSLQNINVTLKENTEGNTALHLACLSGHETIALLIIKQFPDVVYIRNSDRQTPLFYASDSVRKAIKNAFISKMPGFVNSVNNKNFSDVRFVVQDRPIYAHRIIIMCRCPQLLISESKEIYVKDMEHSVFLNFVHYLYTDTIPPNTDKASIQKLVKCAERYDILRLKKLCLDLTTTIDIAIPPSTFKAEMKKAINNEEFSDVVFIVEGKAFFGHKAILSQHEYFRTMFSAKLRESHQKEIPMLGINYEVFDVVMSFTYTWEMEDIPPDFVAEVLQATDQFLIEGLRHCAEAYLCSCIAKDNVCALFQLAETYKCLFLKEECFDFLVLYYKTVKETEEFGQLSPDLQEEITEYVVTRPAYLAKQSKKTNKKDNEYSSLL